MHAVLLAIISILLDSRAPATVPADQIDWLGGTEKIVVAIYGDGAVTCWDARTSKRLANFSLPKARSRFGEVALAVAKADSVILAVLERMDNRCEVTLRSLPSGDRMQAITVPERAKVIALSPDVSTIAVVSPADCAVEGFDTRTAKSLWKYDGRAYFGPIRIAWQPREPILAFCDGEECGAVTRDGKRVWTTTKTDGFVEFVGHGFSASSHFTLINKTTGHVEWRDAETGKADRTSLEIKGIEDRTFETAPSGTVCAEWAAGRLMLRDLSTGKSVEVPNVASRPDIQFTADARAILLLPPLEQVRVGNAFTRRRADSKIRVVDAASATEVCTIDASDAKR